MPFDMKAVQDSMTKIKENLMKAKELPGRLKYDYKDVNPDKQSGLYKQAKAFKSEMLEDIKGLGLAPADQAGLEAKCRDIADELNQKLQVEYERLSSLKTAGEEWREDRWNKIFDDAKTKINDAVTGLPVDTKSFVDARNAKLDSIKSEGLQKETDSLKRSSDTWVGTQKIVALDLQAGKVYGTKTFEIFQPLVPPRDDEELSSLGLMVSGGTDLDKAARKKYTTLVESAEEFFKSDKYKGIIYEKSKDSQGNESIKIKNFDENWFFSNKDKYRHAARGNIECLIQKYGVQPGDTVIVSYNDPEDKLSPRRHPNYSKILIQLEELEAKGLHGKLDPRTHAYLEELSTKSVSSISLLETMTKSELKIIKKILALEKTMIERSDNAKLVGKNHEEMQANVEDAKSNLSKNAVAKAQLEAAVTKYDAESKAAVAGSTPPPLPLDAAAVLTPTDHATKYLPADAAAKLAIAKSELDSLNVRVEESKRAQDLVDAQIKAMTASLDKEASPKDDAFGFKNKGSAFSDQVEQLRSLQEENVKELTDLSHRANAWEVEMKKLSTDPLITGDAVQKKLFDDTEQRLTADKATVAATTTRAKDDAPLVAFKGEVDKKTAEADAVVSKRLGK